MKRMFGILALMVIASIMIAGCVQPEGNETPMETPVETPMETPAETPEETPMETPAETPEETPMETPAETPEETPMETPAETPEETPMETPPGTPPVAVAADEFISISDGGFVPDQLTVSTGTTVGWTNDASSNQTVTGTGDIEFFSSDLLQPGDSYSHTFNAVGNHTYQSQTSGFAGMVIVTPANNTTT